MTKEATPKKGGLGESLFLICGLLGVMIAGPGHRGARPVEVPRTAAGAFAAASRGRIRGDAFTDRVQRQALAMSIHLLNRARPAAPYLLLICLPVALVPIKTWRVILDWPSPALLGIAALTGAAGTGALLALPVSWPIWALLPSACLAGSNILVPLALLVVVAMRPVPDKGKKILHAPKFCPPPLPEKI